jgi:hypothetical protein
MRQHPWKTFALIWSSVIAGAVLIQVLLAQDGSSKVNWNAVGVGLAVGLTFSAAMTWDLRRGHRQPDKDIKP